jgi:hypothetical protein
MSAVSRSRAAAGAAVFVAGVVLGTGFHAGSAAALWMSASGHRGDHVGSSIRLRSDDEDLRITLLKVRNPARVAGEFGAPRPGHKLVAVLLKLTNLGRVFYRDSPGNGARLIGSFRDVYLTMLPGLDPNLDGYGGMRQGESQVGWLTFEVPITMRPWKLRFVLDSGFADQTGEWLLR